MCIGLRRKNGDSERLTFHRESMYMCVSISFAVPVARKVSLRVDVGYRY